MTNPYESPYGYGYDGYGYRRPPETHTKAVGGLICAIGAYVACPVVLAVVALVLANQSDQEIRASRGLFSGESMNRATRILAWVNILGVVVVFASFLVLGGALWWGVAD